MADSTDNPFAGIESSLTSISAQLTQLVHKMSQMGDVFGSAARDMGDVGKTIGGMMDKVSSSQRDMTNSIQSQASALLRTTKAGKDFEKSLVGVHKGFGLLSSIVDTFKFSIIQSMLGFRRGMSLTRIEGARLSVDDIRKRWSEVVPTIMKSFGDVWKFHRNPKYMDDWKSKYDKSHRITPIISTYNDFADSIVDIFKNLGISLKNSTIPIRFQMRNFIKIISDSWVLLKHKAGQGLATLGQQFNLGKLIAKNPQNAKTLAAMAGRGGLMGGAARGMGAFMGAGGAGGGISAAITGVGAALGISAAAATVVVGVIVGGIALILKLIHLFDKFDKMATQFRMNMGFLAKYSEGITQQGAAAARAWGKFGADLSDSLSSFEAISDVIGTANATTGMVSQMILFNKQLGIGYSTSADFLLSMGMLGRKSMDDTKNLMFSMGALSQTSLVNLSTAMSDVNDAMKSSYALMRKTPAEMVKAAVAARRMGTDLSSTMKSAESLMDFTSNIKAEMEASVLVGKSIDGQKMRSLAYSGDALGLQQEQLSLLKQMKFENLDYFQKAAVANFFGKSAYDLGKMLQAERERLKTGKSLRQIHEEEYKRELKNVANQTALKNISNAFGQIWIELAPSLLEIAETLRSWIPIINTLVNALTTALKVGTLINNFNPMAPSNYTRGFSGQLDKIVKDYKSVGTSMERMFESTSDVSELSPQLQRDFVKPELQARMDYGSQLQSYDAIKIGEATTQEDMATNNKLLARVADINEKLYAGLMSGGIHANTYLDGQKVSETLGRSLIFRGERAPSQGA